MINSTLITLYILIFLFIVLYFNKEKLKSLFLKFKKSEKGRYVKICPRCGSINIGTDFSNPVVWDYGTNPKYKCKSCSYIAVIFPEVLESNIQDYRKQLKQKIKEGSLKFGKEVLIDTSTGFWTIINEILALFLVFIIIMFIAGVYFINKNNTTAGVLIISGILLVLGLIRVMNQNRVK